MVELLAGERLPLPNDQIARILCGSVEVYAFTKGGDFHQLFLMHRDTSQVIFPALDDFDVVDIQLYATADSKIEFLPINFFNDEDFKFHARAWFHDLIQLDWLKILADKGDDSLRLWQSDIFTGPNSFEIFLANQQIFSTLIGVRFRAEDKRFAGRIQIRKRHNLSLAEGSVANLLGEEPINPAAANDNLNLIFHAAARALNLNPVDFNPSPEIVKKLDPVALLRRFADKNNMILRMVELPNNWFNSDSGVLIGYLNSTPAAFIPASTSSYKIFSADFHGVPLTPDLAANINPSAFSLYPLLPSQPINILQLLKFLFNKFFKKIFLIRIVFFYIISYYI